MCKKWCSITQFQSIISKNIVRLTTTKQIDLYLQSFRKFHFDIGFGGFFSAKFHQFKEKFFENIVEITLWNKHGGIIRTSSFADTISSLVPLKNLRKFTVACYYETYDNLPDNLSLSVTELDLQTPPQSLMEILVFYSILSCTPRLEKLSLDVFCNDGRKEIAKHFKNFELTKN